MFITITARKESTCRRCGGTIAVGQRIRWERRAGSYHLKAECGIEAQPVRCEVCGVDPRAEEHLPSCFHYPHDAEELARREAERAAERERAETQATRAMERAAERAERRYWERVDNYRELGYDPD